MRNSSLNKVGATQPEVSGDMEVLYQQYATYMDALHADLRAQGINEKYMTSKLSFAEFCIAWNRWGDTEDLQEVWRRKFTAGYEAVGREISRRLLLAFTRQPETAADRVLTGGRRYQTERESLAAPMNRGRTAEQIPGDKLGQKK